MNDGSLFIVIPALGAGIHAFNRAKGVDARTKSGHDGI
jgi:hypothetical protein